MSLWETPPLRRSRGRPASLLPSWELVPGRPASSSFPFVDRFATSPSGGGESAFAGAPEPPRPPHRRRLEWEGARILEAGGLGGREGFASVVLCLGSWLFRSDSSLLTRLNEDNLVPGWVGSHLKRHRVRTGPEGREV